MPRSHDNNHDKPIREEIKLYYLYLPELHYACFTIHVINGISLRPRALLYMSSGSLGCRRPRLVQWQHRLVLRCTLLSYLQYIPYRSSMHPFLSYVAPSELHCTIWAKLHCTPLSCAMYPIELQSILFWAIPHPFELHCTLLSYPPFHTLHPAELCCTLLNYASTSEQCCTLLRYGHSNESTELYAASYGTMLRRILLSYAAPPMD